MTSCVFTVLGAASPALWGVGVTQTVARGMSTALGLLIGVMAAEESPAGSRAYFVSVLAMFAGLGSGMVVWFLPLADVDPAGWRLLYLLAAIGIPVVWLVARRLPESKRFESMVPGGSEAPAPATHRSRLVLLSVTALLFALFAAPASQFLNDFLKEERGFSAPRISLFQITTNTLVGVGVLVGGRLADRRGRRIVGALAVIGGATLVVLRYSLSGWTMWAAGMAGSVMGAATVPALGVYGAEMFGTARRGRSKAKITIVGVIGSAIGLVVVGILADRIGYSTTFALLGLGPLAVAAIVLTRYPETARRELEDINPEDVVIEQTKP
jgi:predicted MFS family arabinose efflux permease